MKTKIFNLIARVTAIATIVSSVAVMSPVKGADLEYGSDTMSRLKISEAANHDIRFYSPNLVPNASDVVLTFNANTNLTDKFDFDAVVAGDLSLNISSAATTDCANVTFGALGTTAFSVGTTTYPDPETITANIDTDITAGYCVQVLIANLHAVNPGTVGAYELTIEAGDDTMGVGIAIVDDDQVTVTANVDPSMHFDLDTTTAATLGTAATEHSAPYTVDFGTLDPTDAFSNVSGDTGINYIHMELDTNATHGAVITIQNTAGSDGMVSTSDGVDNIANATGTMSVNTELYGFCVGDVSQKSGATMTAATGTVGDWAASASNCNEGAEGNAVVEMSSTPDTIFTVDGPVEDAEAFLIGSADASVLTEAHDDYVDVLTFIATGTF